MVRTAGLEPANSLRPQRSGFTNLPTSAKTHLLSRLLSRVLFLGRSPSPGNDHSSVQLPETGRAARNASVRLAPSGVYLQPTVTSGPVVSYTTLSPLPVPEGHRRSSLCCTCQRITPSWISQAPCSLEPGLSSMGQAPPRSSCLLSFCETCVDQDFLLLVWCSRRDLNPQGFLRPLLRRLRLPISPLEQRHEQTRIRT